MAAPDASNSLGNSPRTGPTVPKADVTSKGNVSELTDHGLIVITKNPCQGEQHRNG